MSAVEPNRDVRSRATAPPSPPHGLALLFSSLRRVSLSSDPSARSRKRSRPELACLHFAPQTANGGVRPRLPSLVVPNCNPHVLVQRARPPRAPARAPRITPTVVHTCGWLGDCLIPRSERDSQVHRHPVAPVPVEPRLVMVLHALRIHLLEPAEHQIDVLLRHA